jgi:uncharacterized membrane-anchored protein YhcB (DUF1043 family)
MISVIAFLGGVVVGAIVLYFIARNNKAKALKYLMKDLNMEIEILKSKLMEELGDAKEDTKIKINHLLNKLKEKLNK